MKIADILREDSVFIDTTSETKNQGKNLKKLLKKISIVI